MEQANKLFILSEVADHIVAEIKSYRSTVNIVMRHTNDKAPNRLRINVDRVDDGFVISYDAIYNGKRITQSKSDPVPGEYVQKVIADIANDTIPAGVV